MEITQLYQIFLSYPQVCTDTRQIIKDSLFFALKGASFDGNQFAGKALEGGAAYVVVDDPSVVCQGDDRYILVDNVLKALQELACHHRKVLKLPVLAITGTNGKTTTKELVATVLNRGYSVLATEGNLNNHIGVPLTLLKLKEDHQLAVIEMGASHPGDIKELVDIACPDYGIITNIGKAHLEGFGSIEGVRRTKGELYDYIREHDGIVFVNSDDPVLMEMSEGIRRVTYGTKSSATFYAQIIYARPVMLSFRWRQISVPHDISTHLVGEYNLPNALAAVAVGRFFDVATDGIMEAIADYVPTNNRSQLIETEKNTVVVDAYNANPVSMQVAIRNFGNIRSDREKILILGDMKELGKESLAEHKTILSLLTESRFDRVLLVGDEFGKALAELECAPQNFEHYDSADVLAEEFGKNPIADKLILIKGSHSVHLEKIISLC